MEGSGSCSAEEQGEDGCTGEDDVIGEDDVMWEVDGTGEDGRYGRMRDEQWVQVIHPSALKHLKLNVLISTQKQILGVRVDADIETGHT